MREAEIAKLICSVARTIGVIGDAWTLLILRELFLQTRRFEEFQAQTGMSPILLTDRLARLEACGIVVRTPYSERPARHEYRLTEKGLDLYPIVVSMTRWGDRWTDPDAEEGPPLRLVHKDCGQPFEPALSCSSCGERLTARDVRVEMRADMAAERGARRARFFAGIGRKRHSEAQR